MFHVVYKKVICVCSFQFFIGLRDYFNSFAVCDGLTRNTYYIISGSILSDFANRRNFSSVQPKPRSSRIFSGVCVQRLPLITREKSELEKQFEELQHQLEIEHSALSEDEVQWKEIMDRKENAKDEDDDESIAIAISEADRKVF